MSSVAIPRRKRGLQCHYRPMILATAAALLLSMFWLATRYPQLIGKARHVGQAVSSMAFSREVIRLAADAPVWQKILATAVNWLDSMRVGMSFGVLLGALLHTTLRYYPLKIGRNLYLNSLKGALIGVPMGVCANCAVPTACGVTRGHGRVEVALGFLFSSPNFNPVIVAMTFMALPLAMGVTKYLLILGLIVVVVPVVIGWLERSAPLIPLTTDPEAGACSISFGPGEECAEPFGTVFKELARDFLKNVWMLLKPTITIMLLASLASAAMLVLIPWSSLLAEPTPLKLLLVSFLAVLMPVPIALDVMFAAQLQSEGIPAGFVMLFAMTLGTYSIIPSVYLWRDVSKRLSVILFTFFVLLGWIVGLIF